MADSIRIGNQTAFSASTVMEPLEFAVTHGFRAFEWFADKKTADDGSPVGWDETDMDKQQRNLIRRIGESHDVVYTVHAPWQANPLHPRAERLLKRSLDFARDIGADLVNLHLYMDRGAHAYVEALVPVISYAAHCGVRLSIENTPLTGPGDFNDTFALLDELPMDTDHLGMCLDIGHANLFSGTRNDYIRYLDALAPRVPIIHLHLHENWGDRDSHLTLFTGPARNDDAGVKALVERLRRRRYSGAMILEQWPQPPELLVEAERHLQRLLGAATPSRDQRIPKEIRSASQPSLRFPAAHTRDRTGQTVATGDRQAAADAPGAPRAAATGRREPAENSSDGASAKEDPEPAPSPPSVATPPLGAFGARLVAAHANNPSWRQRLDWIREVVCAPDFAASPEQLADLAIYLRFLGTGEVSCEEDGRHFRPRHHAEAALTIEKRLEAVTAPRDRWILRKIHPWLPSYSRQFQRSEPLTRIRDIAHRNDIPQAFKREIKHRLQNKLHRCAAPEDLDTSREMLERVTAPGTDYSPEFVAQFRIFHEELSEFFNAGTLEQRLSGLLTTLPAGDTAPIRSFLRLKTKPPRAPGQLQELLDRLTDARRHLSGMIPHAGDAQAQQMHVADIGLEDYAFVLLSEAADRFDAGASSPVWNDLLHTLAVAVANVGLGEVETAECAAVVSELRAWAAPFDPSREFHLLRVKATLERAGRITESYTDQVLALFPPRVAALGRALGVMEHAIGVFCEGDIRGNLVFQLAKLVETAQRCMRTRLNLSPWSGVAPGQAAGRLVCCHHLETLPVRDRPVIVLLEVAEGDEEIPLNVRGILLGHSIPHLSHLGVRSRQAGIAFATAGDREEFTRFEPYLNEPVELRVSADDVSLAPTVLRDRRHGASAQTKNTVIVPPAKTEPVNRALPLSQARPESCGAKASAAARLVALAGTCRGLFHAPRGIALPFGVMEYSLAQAPRRHAEYLALQKTLDHASGKDLDTNLHALREILLGVDLPAAIGADIQHAFASGTLVAVRSSANGEDLENLPSAGLYESRLGVSPAHAEEAIRQVWASLWTHRAAMSRARNAIPHAAIHMAVLIQELVVPDLSFIMHTADPFGTDSGEAWVELAVGLGETLASAAQPGTPYRMRCNRGTGKTSMTACASFSLALRPGGGNGPAQERIDYSRAPWSADPAAIPPLGERLAKIAVFLETAFGTPQDVEGILAGGDIHVVQSRPQQGNAAHHIGSRTASRQ